MVETPSKLNVAHFALLQCIAYVICDAFGEARAHPSQLRAGFGSAQTLGLARIQITTCTIHLNRLASIDDSNSYRDKGKGSSTFL
jgi:hypothetical protein